MVSQNIVYILAISLQMAGALLLIISFWGKTRQRIIDGYFSGHVLGWIEDDDCVTITRDDLISCVCRIYDNRAAFVFIAIGYVLGVLSNSYSCNKWIMALCVIISSVLFVLVEKFFACLIAKKIYKSEMKVSRGELLSKVDAWID